MVGAAAAGRIAPVVAMAAGNEVPLASAIKHRLGVQGSTVTMKTLDRYIGSSFFRSFGLIISILLVLFSFLELLTQLDDIGKGSYQIPDVILYILLTVPRRMLDLMAISTLLGGIIALGMLADHRELLAMQAAGVSARRICLSVLASGSILMLATLMLAELVVPPMDELARTRRSLALSDTGVTVTKQGFWARQGNAYIHVGKALSDGAAADIDIFETDAEGRLLKFTHAREAKIQSDNQWLLQGISLKTFTKQGIVTRQIASRVLDSFLSSEQVGILELPASSMSAADLHRYIRAMKESGQNADRYSLALWRKLSLPLTTGAMILLALPYIFGASRRVTAAKRIVMGSFVGIALYFADQLAVHLGLLLSLHPVITALAPVVLIAGLAGWQLRRTILVTG
jgi:lipopolysaccharide export system permease protein